MATRSATLLATTLLLLSACAPASAPGPAAAPAGPAEAARSAPAVAPGGPAIAPAAPPPAAEAPSADRGTAAAPAPTVAARPQPPKAAAAPATGAPAAQPPQPGPIPAPTPAPRPTADQEAAPLPPVKPLDRMVVYTTDLTLLVKSVAATIGAIGDIAVAQGGYVAGVENSTEGGLPTSTVRIKVLPDRYQATMNQLRGLAVEVAAEKATTQDVTEEYNDVQTQLASLEATHRQLLELLGRAGTTDEVLRIQQQAAQVKLQIDRLKGRITALERLSDLATITARVQSAEAVLGKDYTGVRSQLRQAQAQQADQLLALKRARTPEEENAIKDKLSELALQIDRATARLNDIAEKAKQAGFALPTTPPDEASQAVSAEKDLAQQYIDARIQLRQAEVRQAELTRRLQQNPPAEKQAALRRQLTETILEISRLNVQLKTIQDRAAQTGVALPNLTPEQLAALAGTPVEISQPDPLRAVLAAWEASLAFLRSVLAGLLGAIVFLWWAIPLAALLAVLLIRSGFGRGWIARRPTP